MRKYVIVDLKTNEKFEKETHMPAGYAFYQEVIFDDLISAKRTYDGIIKEKPDGINGNGLVIEKHENGEKETVYDYNIYCEEYNIH